MPDGTSVWRRRNNGQANLCRGFRLNEGRGLHLLRALVLASLCLPQTAAAVAQSVPPQNQPAAASAEEPSLPVRGVVRALDQSALSTDLAARVLKIGFREGEAFRAGDLLIAFDCERYRAEAQSADAVFKEMELTLNSNMRLERMSAVGKADVEISRARVAKAEAEARSLKARVAQCEIAAPFDGRVAELSVNLYEQPQAGKPFLVIVGNSRLEIELIVPSHWLTWVKPGAELAFNVDETRHVYKAHVVRLGAAVDAVSQMIKIIATFDDPVTDVLPGMSGAAQFRQPNG